jgi:Putative O-methyltransferase
MMASFDVVNYSLRPSKNIQRQIIFDGVRLLQLYIDFDRLMYIGFGSIWFTDFVMAHKLLYIDDMISIESDPTGYRRAVFNSPYATVKVHEGYSTHVLQQLYNQDVIAQRSWMIWLDYDHEFTETISDDIRSVIAKAPKNSVFLITFDGKEAKYGHAHDRVGRLRQLFGDVIPDELDSSRCKGALMQQTLADSAINFMTSIAGNLARPGGFVPAFRVMYKDSAPMVTVGGLLPANDEARSAAVTEIGGDWPCHPEKPIVAPNLTIREAALLQSQLPRSEPLSREAVRSLGFDLEDEQIEAFVKYYRQYPAFAQIVA